MAEDWGEEYAEGMTDYYRAILESMKRIKGGGIPMKGLVTISPNPTPLGANEPATPAHKEDNG